MKRIIFTLLHCDGQYMLSRNFRLQRVGDIDWVLRHYEIRRVSLGIDELMVLDVSAEGADRTTFFRDIQRLVEECFIPVTVGGWLRSRDDASACFAAGADKVLMNRAFLNAPAACEDVAATFGSQALIAGIDVVDSPHDVQTRPFVGRSDLKARVAHAVALGAGEVLVQSVERDGTGNGLDLSLPALAESGSTPLILMGGVGQASHLSDGLRDDGVDAVATANLFNFIGDSLLDSRSHARETGVPIATWPQRDFDRLRGILRDCDAEAQSVEHI